MLFWYTWDMPTIKENNDITRKRLAQEANASYKQEQLDKLSGIRDTQLNTMRALVEFLSGHTTKTEVVNQLKSISTPDVDKVVGAVEQLGKSIADKSIDWLPVLTRFDQVIKQLESIPKEHPDTPEQQEVDLSQTNNLLESLNKAITDIKLVVPTPEVTVKVPKTQLTVEKVDLRDVKKPLADILVALQSIEIPPTQLTDLASVEGLLGKSNELLDKIAKKPVGGGGGGGGGMVSYKNPDGLSVQVQTEADGSIPVTVISGGGGTTPLSTYSYIQKDTTDTVYKYYGYADGNTAGAWAIKRITISTNLAEYVKGTTGYTAAWTARDDGSTHTYADLWTTF